MIEVKVCVVDIRESTARRIWKSPSRESSELNIASKVDLPTVCDGELERSTEGWARERGQEDQEGAWPKWLGCIGMRSWEKGRPWAGEV